ncbi:GNAT family N-acetyltransferase [Microbacterium sp.]|uniref:GNAT family N-acetyltransferase n=1 Tax=Microbacterium sp. TaxID=51671 RepID=UPI0028119A79|nr:GNAT family N-acetyltransferase [Microbacterium sp.]
MPNTDMTLIDLDTDDERWALAFPVLQELRPHLTQELLRQVLAEGTAQGLRFTAVFDGDRCVAVAGWRVLVTTHVLRKLHIDDLATASGERSKGYGSTLLNALIHRARDLGCGRVELNSAVHRHSAHRFYLRERLDIDAHHFGLQLS